MLWLDVCGSPGSGKSTLCDVIWGPHELPIQNRLPPTEWHDFLNEITRLFHLIDRHLTFPAAIRMNNRSIRKIATVARRKSDKTYVQTGLVQRGLGFGWRMNDMGIDLGELRHYFRLMPVSLGVACARCPQEVVEQRNHDRKKVPATAHEDRAHMVGLMAPAIDIALEVLRDRGCPVMEISTNQPIDQARKQLVAFAAQGAGHGAAARSGGEMEAVLSPPPWWQ